MNILLLKEMYERLYKWTKARVGTSNHGPEDDELMETGDHRDQVLDLQAEVEDVIHTSSEGMN